MTQSSADPAFEHLLRLMDTHVTLFKAVPASASFRFDGTRAWQARTPIPLSDGEPYLFLELSIETDEQGYFTGYYGLTHSADEFDLHDRSPLRISDEDDMNAQLTAAMALWPYEQPHQVQTQPVQDMQRFVRQFAGQLHGIVEFPPNVREIWEQPN